MKQLLSFDPPLRAAASLVNLADLETRPGASEGRRALGFPFSRQTAGAQYSSA